MSDYDDDDDESSEELWRYNRRHRRSRRSYPICDAPDSDDRPCLEVHRRDGSIRRVPVTPLVVIMYGLDDPYYYASYAFDTTYVNGRRSTIDDDRDIDDNAESSARRSTSKKKTKSDGEGKDDDNEEEDEMGFDESGDNSTIVDPANPNEKGANDNDGSEDEVEAVVPKEQDEEENEEEGEEDKHEDDEVDDDDEPDDDEEQEYYNVANDDYDYDDDDSDSANSDDDDNVIDAGEVCLRGVVDVMRKSNADGYDRYRYRSAVVSFMSLGDGAVDEHDGSDDDDDDDDDHHDDNDDARSPTQEQYVALFRAFVARLSSFYGVRRLELIKGNFGVDLDVHFNDDNDEGQDENDEARQIIRRRRRRRQGRRRRLRRRPDDTDVHKLFGSVLCDHKSLQEVVLNDCRISPHCWKLFTTSVPTYTDFLNNKCFGNLKSLSIQCTPLSLDNCQLLGSMLQRDVMLRKLVLDRCGIDSDGWRAVCDGVASNRFLLELELCDKTVLECDTLLGAVGPTSPLVRLDVTAAIASDGFATECFGSALRANAQLQVLKVIVEDGLGNDAAQLLEELLDAYNWTIEDVTIGPLKDGVVPPAELDEMVERNARVRVVQEQVLPDASVQPSMWPMVLKEVSAFPTLLYRFVQKYQMEAFVDHVTHVQNSSIKKRSRDCLKEEAVASSP